MKIQHLILLLAAVLGAQTLSAQYFGRNKAKYETFDFEVYQSPNFDIYHYLENPERLREITEEAEQWYRMHQHVLRDTIAQRNPLIFYNDHADFQQTNAISGNVGVGTGGVTEALKNRVIMPFAMSHQQTHHVLGHELVHAFQYNMILNGDSTNLQSLSNLPLWMVEGMAEYLSIG
ncbi:basic secretory protein-like protein, partial [Phaeodactylibacter sp.]